MGSSTSKPAVEIDLGRAIDRIGFLDELWSRIGDPLRANVKGAMRLGTKAPGAWFEAHKIGGMKTVVEAEGFVRLWESGKITRAQFVATISVLVAPARELLAEGDFARISASEAATPKLTVKRLPEMTVELADAMEEVALAVREKAE